MNLKAKTASECLSDPRLIWGVYLGQLDEPIRPPDWPAHSFAADPGGDDWDSWAIERRWRCKGHQGCGCLVPQDGSGSEISLYEPFCKACMECDECTRWRELWRRGFCLDAVAELRRCESDWRGFVDRYMKIRSPPPAEDAITPKNWPRQRELIDIVLEGLLPSMPMESGIYDHIIWKSRSQGVSEVVAATSAFLHALFVPMSVVRCFSRDTDEAKRWLSQVQDYMWAHLPEWMRPPRNPQSKGRRNEKSLKFSWFDVRGRPRGQQSVIESHGGIGRGGPATLLIFDEISTMKDYFARYQAAGPATSLAKGKTLNISTPEPPAEAKFPKMAAEFRRLCIENGGAEVLQDRCEELKIAQGREFKDCDVPSGLMDVFEHVPGWSGHFSPWHMYPFADADYMERQRRKYKDRTDIEFPSEPMQGFGADDAELPPCIEPELLDEQERLNAEEKREPLQVGGLIPETVAGRRALREFTRGGFVLMDGEEILHRELERHLCGMPDIHNENRDRREIAEMKVELQMDLTGIKLWCLPDPGESFWVEVDPSDGGHDGDKAAITWWSCDRLCTVATWTGHLYQEAIADLAQVGSKWVSDGNRSLSEVCFDTSGKTSAAIAARAVEKSGERVFYRKNRGKAGGSKADRRSVIGFLFTADTKREAAEALNELLLGGNVRLFDPEMIAQLRKLRWKTIVRQGKTMRIVWTLGETNLERADDLADTALAAAAKTLHAEHYRRGVKPGESLRKDAEEIQRRKQRLTLGKRSPQQDGRIRRL